MRRPLRIPNPISYTRLAEVLEQQWTDLRNFTWATRLSATRPQVLKNSPRAVTPRYRYAEVPRLRALRRRGKRYVLCTDINQFYPTIYTHAIPWALHTKAACKANLALGQKKLTLPGDSIDKAFQTMNDGQTHGIPIGPDASLVAAEVLLAAVDAELVKRCGHEFQGFRYVDDYELGFSTLKAAEQTLIELQGILADYDLQLNPRKTGIYELPRNLDDSWAIELAQARLRGVANPISQRTDVLSLFSRAFELASEQPEKSVLRYAVARVQSLVVTSKSWKTFQNCLLGAASADPATLPVVLGSLFRVSEASGTVVSKYALAQTFESIISTHAPQAHGSEVAWALWGALAWGVQLDGALGKVLGDMDDDIVALLALEVSGRGLLPAGTLDTSRWQTAVAHADALKSEHWLLAYEAHLQGWLNVPAVAAHPVFKSLADGKISFLDKTKNVPLFPSAAGPIPGGMLEDFYA